jgi:hypothetical protein
MNKLCISKLLQVIEQDLIPTERGGGSGGSIERKSITTSSPLQQPQPQQLPQNHNSIPMSQPQPTYQSSY